MTNTVLPWSISTLTAYETCPRRYYLVKVTKQVAEKPFDATTHGNQLHKAIELDLKGKEALPAKFSKYAPLLHSVRTASGRKTYEEKFGLDARLRPVGFFDKTVWVRGAMDVAIVQPELGVALDWKSGKQKESMDQKKLYAAVMLETNPHLEKVKTGFIWLQTGKVDKNTFTREDVPMIWEDFFMRVSRMEKALAKDNFPPNPSGLCRNYCPVGKKLCDFCGE